MNPARFATGDLSLVVLVSLLALCGLLLAGAVWVRQRERRGDWGPGIVGVQPDPRGYAPADLRRGVSPTRVVDLEDPLLLGLAAPFVEQAGLLHDRWSLVPAFCDDAWKRQLAAVADRWGVVRARAWRRETDELERRLAATMAQGKRDDEAVRVWLTASFAMLLRLGVALRHTNAPRARARLRAAAASPSDGGADWLRFGDDFLTAAERFLPGRTAELRADVRTLYAAEGPWHVTG